jgi:hypothetical protein
LQRQIYLVWVHSPTWIDLGACTLPVFQTLAASVLELERMSERKIFRHGLCQLGVGVVSWWAFSAFHKTSAIKVAVLLRIKSLESTDYPLPILVWIKLLLLCHYLLWSVYILFKRVMEWPLTWSQFLDQLLLLILLLLKQVFVKSQLWLKCPNILLRLLWKGLKHLNLRVKCFYNRSVPL